MVATIIRLNRIYDSLIDYKVFINDEIVKISNNKKLKLNLKEGENVLYVKSWHTKSNTLILLGNKNHEIEIKNYVTNKQFYIYVGLIFIGIYFSFFKILDSFYFNFFIKFIGFYIISIPIVSFTFNSNRNLLIEELNI